MREVTIWWCFIMIVVYSPMIISLFAIGFYDHIPHHVLEGEGATSGDMILEDDMIFTKDQADSLKKVGLVDQKYRWPNNTLVYDFDCTCSDDDIEMITYPINTIRRELKGCISFERRKKRDKRNYLLIKCPQTGRNCNCTIGYQSKRNGNQMNLCPPCLRDSTIIHETFHSLGLLHMMCAYNRDRYVKIQYENIIQESKHEFRKFGKRKADLFGVPYDYGSIMHYGEYAFSKNGKKTIIPKNRHAVIGVRVDVSRLDYRRLRRMYKCK